MTSDNRKFVLPPPAPPRNVYVPLAIARKAGKHQKSEKAIRKAANQRKPEDE